MVRWIPRGFVWRRRRRQAVSGSVPGPASQVWAAEITTPVWGAASLWPHLASQTTEDKHEVTVNIKILIFYTDYFWPIEQNSVWRTKRREEKQKSQITDFSLHPQNFIANVYPEQLLVSESKSRFNGCRSDRKWCRFTSSTFCSFWSSARSISRLKNKSHTTQKLLTGGLWTYQLNAAVSSSAPLSSDKRRPSGVKSWYVQTLYVK